ncbi:MAG: hypothetical protein M1816_007463 [Peltula sp. TS41687]|nr:MAG: hypothetical protein M1816_007463 [Peltula sp. TS41687]
MFDSRVFAIFALFFCLVSAFTAFDSQIVKVDIGRHGCHWCPVNNVIHPINSIYKNCMIIRYQTDEFYYLGACYDSSPEGSKSNPHADIRTPDQDWADDAKAFLGYYARASKPKRGAAKSAINSDKSASLQSVHATQNWGHHRLASKTADQMIQGINRLIQHDEFKPNLNESVNGIAIVPLKWMPQKDKFYTEKHKTGVVFYPDDCAHHRSRSCERKHNAEWDWLPNNERGYAPGWCGVHVNNGQGRSASGYWDYFSFWAYVNDANGFMVGWAGEQQVKDKDETMGITGKLPLVMLLAGGDQEHVTFAYGGQRWDSSDKERHFCSEGVVDDEVRRIDCGFTC